ncbi:MAG: Protease HtpX [Prosthecobacter sp.]|nr:Protease HtpX [Prosthecobacter sp.]
MNLSNPWFVAALAAVLGVFHLELVVRLLNLARLGRPVPPELEDTYPEETREKLQAYISDGARVDVMREATGLAALLLFWWCGGFGTLQAEVNLLGWGPVTSGVIVIAVMMLAQSLLGLPFAAWDTFGVEERHGFNRMTWRTFAGDHLKSLALMAVLGLPAAWVVVWLFHHEPLAPLHAWLFLAAVSVLMTWLAPRVLMPLFLKFTPLEAGPLREAILELAGRLQFPVQEVSIVDGSRRSSKANAFFAGFGRTRRIALFDTLLQNHGQEEILAILAHEIGHNKCRHVPVNLALGLAEMGLMLALLGWALKSPDFFAAFGVRGTPAGMGLVLFGILYQPLGVLTGLLGLAVSRRHEFQADAYARRAMGGGRPLMDSLRKLSHDHLSHPQPHPLAVWLHYSHPPLAERLAALNRD